MHMSHSGHSHSEASDGQHRFVWLPLAELDKCAVCGKSEHLRLCSSCSECIYCSAECQKNDWPSHKLRCGKTDRLDLASFYPFIASIIEQCHVHRDKPMHPALCRQIVNDTDSGSFSFSSGQMDPKWSGAKTFMLGRPIDLSETGSEMWWLNAASPKVRMKIFRRITRSGYVLPILTAACVSLLAEFYTTSSGAILPSGEKNPNPQQRRTRLRYRSSPIADFGIATGSAVVSDPKDKLAYFDVSNGSFIKGQDPDEHYWIYFTTLRGEEVILDCAMFTFNMCMMVPTAPYLPQHLSQAVPHAPAVFEDRLLRRNTPSLRTERKRLSVLRNQDMHRAVMHSNDGFDDPDVLVFAKFMETLSGRKCTAKEVQLCGTFAALHCNLMSYPLVEQRWKTFPETPMLMIESDPGELDDIDDNSSEWSKELHKLQKKSRKKGHGDLSRDQIDKEYRKWRKVKGI